MLSFNIQLRKTIYSIALISGMHQLRSQEKEFCFYTDEINQRSKISLFTVGLHSEDCSLKMQQNIRNLNDNGNFLIAIKWHYLPLACCLASYLSKVFP